MSVKELNSAETVKLRRYRASLVTDGIGIITFGLWSIIKIIMTLLMQPFDLQLSDSETISDPTERMLVIVFAVVFVIISVAIILGIHMFVGLSAYREGRNGKKGSFYIVAAGLMAIFICLTMTLYFVSTDGGQTVSLTSIAAFIIDLTTVILLLDMIYAAFMSRKLAIQLESEAI